MGVRAHVAGREVHPSTMVTPGEEAQHIQSVEVVDCGGAGTSAGRQTVAAAVSTARPPSFQATPTPYSPPPPHKVPSVGAVNASCSRRNWHVHIQYEGSRRAAAGRAPPPPAIPLW